MRVTSTIRQYADTENDGTSEAQEAPEAGRPGATKLASGRRADGGTEAWVDDLRGTLSGLLGNGSCRIRDLAAARGMSVRTLQRRLAELGLTYLQLVDELRFADARRCLAQPEALLKQVAADLGFREPASFTRACRRWTGFSPREYRRRLRALGSREVRTHHQVICLRDLAGRSLREDTVRHSRGEVAATENASVPG